MTVQLTPADVAGIVEAAVAGGIVLAGLVVLFLVYLLVRPPRRARLPDREEALAGEELRSLVDRMERRLAVLERALADAERRPVRGQEQFTEAGDSPATIRRER